MASNSQCHLAGPFSAQHLPRPPRVTVSKGRESSKAEFPPPDRNTDHKSLKRTEIEIAAGDQGVSHCNNTSEQVSRKEGRQV